MKPGNSRILLLVAGLVVLLVGAWIAFRGREQEFSPPSEPASAPRTIADKRQPAEIVRPPHTPPGSRAQVAATVDTTAEATTGSPHNGAPEVVPPEVLVLSPQRRKQLNRGLSAPAEVPAYDGELVLAQVKVDGDAYHLTPNQVGNFPRVHISAEETVAVDVDFVQGREGEAVSIMVLDGGQLDNGRPIRSETLGSDKKLSFQYQASGQRGIHRVRLTKGADQKILDFWVGEPPPAREN
jgi:hypothetical protein